MYRYLRSEEIIALGAFLLVTSLNIGVYQNSLSPKEILWLMARYFTFGYPFYGLFFLFIYLFYFWKFYIRLASMLADRFFEKKPLSSQDAKELFSYFFYPVRLLTPLVVIAIPFYTLLTNFNYHLRFEGKDLLFFHMDQFLFGAVPFLWLPTYFSSFFWTSLFQYAYFSLAGVMSGALALLFLLSRSFLFRKALLSFMVSLAISFPLFYIFPCQDPNNFFLQNLRGNKISPQIRESLEAYHPSQATKDIILRIAQAETNQTLDASVPVSCFPSMHAVWVFFVIYFLAKVKRWSLFFTVPWALLLLIGGVYFAQHYVVDYFVSIPVAALSIYLACLLLRFEEWMKTKKPREA